MNKAAFTLSRFAFPLLKPLLLVLSFLSFNTEIFSNTENGDVPDYNIVHVSKNDSMIGGAQTNDSLQRFARFHLTKNGSSYYLVSLSLFHSEFERIFFYKKAGTRGIYIADKNNFHNDSALFITTLNKEQAWIEFRELYQQTKDANLSTSETTKIEIVRSSPFHKEDFLNQHKGLNSPTGGTDQCTGANIACSANVYSFPAGTTGEAPPSVLGYPDYGCLGSTPCPAWYYMQVGVAGDITIFISLSIFDPMASPDVDFICWGPFTSLTDGCATGLSGPSIVDCSYSGAATETCHIVNAQVGEFYILLITNFCQKAGMITFSQTGGSGVTNCNNVVHCSMLAITTNTTPCDEPTNTFSVSGNIEFSNPSPTGTLSITDNTAIPPITQTFNAPFSSPLPYTLTNIPCDGANHFLSASFSDSTACFLTQDFVAPQATCPQAQISGGGAICNDGAQQATVPVTFLGGTPPFTFVYAINGTNQTPVTHNFSTPYQILTSTPGVYTLVSVANTACPSGTVSGSATVTVNPLPTASISGSTVVCANTTPPDITFTGASGTAPYTFNYTLNGVPQSKTTIAGNSVTVAQPTGTPGTFVYALVSVSDATLCSRPQTFSATITVNPIPVITPVANQVLCHQASTTAVFISGTVPGTVYTWVNSNTSVGLAAGGTGNISAFTVTNTTIAPVIATITVTPTFTNAGLTCTGNNASFNIIVNPIPTVNTVGNQVLCHQASTSQVFISGNVPGTLYSWTNSNTSVGLPSAGTGDISPFTVTNTTTIPETATINVIPTYTNAGLTCTGNSTSFNITVNPIPTVNTMANQVLCHQASTSSVITSGNVPGTVYSWVNSNTSVGLAAAGTGSISSFTVTNTTTAPVIATITVTPTFTNAGLTCTGNTASFNITVNPIPTVNAVGNQILCHLTSTSPAILSGNVLGTLYSWTNSNTSIGLPSAGTGDISPFMVTNTTTGPETATINVVPTFTNAGLTCTGTATSFNITVNPIPTVNTMADQVLCRQASTSSVIISGNVPGTVYSWVNSNTSVGLAAAGTGSISSFTVTNTTTAPVIATITVTPTFTNAGLTCTGNTASFNIIVNPIPTVNTVGNLVLCDQASTSQIIISGNVPGTLYSWTNSNTSIGLASSGSGDISSFAVTNTTTIPQTATINVIPTFTNAGVTCTGISTSFSITVNPIPTVNAVANQVLCHQASTSPVIIIGNVPGTVYSWINSNTSIGLAAAGTGSISSFSVTNTSTIPVVATIMVTPAYTNAGLTCSGNPISFTISVNPLPIPTITGAGTNCLNLSGTYSTEDTQFNYLWNVLSGGTITSGQTTKQINVLWNAIGTHNITVNYVDLHGCTAASPTFKQVTINSLPSPTITGAAFVCAGETKTYQTQALAQSYSWGLPSSGITVISGGGVLDDQVTIRWDVANVYNISVNYIISTGCTAVAPSNFSVTVNAPPTPQITGITPVCALAAQNYSVTPLVSGHLYSWTVAGGTIQSGQNANTVRVFWENSTSGSLDLIETINYSGISCSAPAPTFPIVLNPWPFAAGSIAGPNSVCKTSTINYTVPSILYATSYQWVYTGTGVNITNNGTSTISVTFTSTATNGTLTVKGVNNCGDGPVSQPLDIAVHNLPEVSFISCNDVVTTPGAKKITLRGGTPFLTGQGVYSGNRVSYNAMSGFYEFDPFGASSGAYPVTYTYTNTFGCTDAAIVNITVSNSSFTCNGDFTDVRDGKKYKTASLVGRCWMAQNLNYGIALINSPVPPQSDNCVAEKYCSPADVSCSTNGGLYQWDELMDYAVAPGAKGLCPPEWHIPTEVEWQQLIDNLVMGITAPDANATVAPELTDPFLLNGFNALLGGFKYQDNTWAFHTGSNKATMYWTSVVSGTDRALARGLNVFTPSISKYTSSRANAFSVRCVKD